jgi:D-xylose transport system permease protein
MRWARKRRNRSREHLGHGVVTAAPDGEEQLKREEGAMPERVHTPARTDEEIAGGRDGARRQEMSAGGPDGDELVAHRGRRISVRDILAREGVAAMMAVAVVAIAFQLQSSIFLSSTNLSNLVVQVVPLVLVALGEAAVILMREIDLSLGSIAGLAAALGGTLMTLHGYSWWTGILAMLACGAALGGLQGALVVVGRVPAFVATLGGSLAFLGLQLNVLGNNGAVNVTDRQIVDLTTLKLSPTLGLLVTAAAYVAWLGYHVVVLRATRAAGKGQGMHWGDLLKPLMVGIIAIGGAVVLNRGGGIPLAFLLAVAIVLAVAGFLKGTATGRHVYAIGGNPEAARRAGVRVRTIRWAGFVVAGMLAASAGLAYLSYDQGASATTGGSTLLLQGIGAAVIGGVSLFGGRGSAWAALTGALVMGGISNGLDLTQHAQPTKYVIEGVVVVLAVLLDSAVRSGFGFRWSPMKAHVVRYRDTLLRRRRNPVVRSRAGSHGGMGDG